MLSKEGTASRKSSQNHEGQRRGLRTRIVPFLQSRGAIQLQTAQSSAHSTRSRMNCDVWMALVVYLPPPCDTSADDWLNTDVLSEQLL